ncbi:MAG: hypothetical protein GY925_13665 [Actinomycetia bacterium]|nr:hypothetical protein [Actinomycetes bacterium]
MEHTSQDSQDSITSNASVLAVATPLEKNTVLEQLLAAHLDLIDEAEGLASGLLSSASAEQIAHELAHQLGSLGFEELPGRAGRIPGRGYVNETDAAWELLEEALDPFLTDIRRRAVLGFAQAAAAIAGGAIAGLDRLREAPDGQLIALAGEDAVDTLTETVLDLAEHLQLDVDEAPNLN